MEFMFQADLLKSECLSATPDAIRQAAEILGSGGLVAFPTETVYGLGADAENPDAVRAMFAAKGRPPDHPVIVHLADAALIDKWAVDVPDAARRLAAAFWPGPMTLVLHRSSRASDLVTGGLQTVGLRVPQHPVAQALLQAFGGAIAAPSANRFGRVSPTQARHVLDDLKGRVALVLDGGSCPVGLESTIIDVTAAQPAILRPGAVSAEQVAEALGRELSVQSAGSPRVSGSLSSHYAPRARVELLRESDLVARAEELAAAGNRVAIVGRAPNSVPPSVICLPLPQDAVAMARELYDILRQVDELNCDVALTSLPEAKGLGIAIADRLRKAAGPRDRAPEPD
jgi:L-threonylcarbamoyladenylate synthase